MSDKPRILLFTGDGKGKTTAALGMALRATGHGLRCCVVQFIKNDDTVGEVAAAAANGRIEMVQCGRGFLPKANEERMVEHRAAAEEGLRTAAQKFASGEYSLVILDEVCVAVARGLLAEEEVRRVVGLAPASTCVVLTGRGATQGLIELADTVTEMVCRKHGYQVGIAAQKGVEW
jgi:cob(I)alamin adenosyltransferase